jgi:hypothetical protein
LKKYVNSQKETSLVANSLKDGLSDGVFVWHALENPPRMEFHDTFVDWLGMGEVRTFAHRKGILENGARVDRDAEYNPPPPEEEEDDDEDDGPYCERCSCRRHKHYHASEDDPMDSDPEEAKIFMSDYGESADSYGNGEERSDDEIGEETYGDESGGERYDGDDESSGESGDDENSEECGGEED